MNKRPKRRTWKKHLQQAAKFIERSSKARKVTHANIQTPLQVAYEILDAII
jgi:hypothetical protein